MFVETTDDSVSLAGAYVQGFLLKQKRRPRGEGAAGPRGEPTPPATKVTEKGRAVQPNIAILVG